MNQLMRGKICMVTGATSGIGRETALGIASLGASVVMVCRERVSGEKTMLDIMKKSGNKKVELIGCDLSSQKAMRDFTLEFKKPTKDSMDKDLQGKK
jgi:short-subunit dehydrogenase